ncbi:SIR2 family protein [Pantoea brenneri]|uniref:SIR2 family protein n=1 Tax=Pantoea brenneri TaxID=472694 RepID=UPI00210AC492|nr:SIR2 family protein [Pantoea brenneri]MCQ5472458.1 SIR2 family protein [Pantoea brenneri]
MDIENELNQLFINRASGPFLFLGSGFSRRYMGLEDWQGLLNKFCVMGKPYEYYKSSANGDIARSALLIAEDFHDLWWTSENYKESREKHSNVVKDKSSPLRIEISRYLIEKTESRKKDLELNDELEILKSCDVDGIITTNWDILIEHLFPDYTTYIGQEELLFSNTYNIGEIYKIHGCGSKPESMILTDADYSDYNSKNAYLASKLITIFVEHPVVFIGYSITDENIRALLKSISLCIGTEKLEKLRSNLIFIDKDEPTTGAIIETSYLHFNDVQVPVKIVKTKDFSLIYQAIHNFERKLPARVLRFCKEQVYEIVQSQDPQNKIAVVDYDNIKDKKDIEIVFGIGVIGKLGDTGYRAITVQDLFEDVALNNKDFSPEKILKITVKQYNYKFIPVFKYLSKMKIETFEDYKKSGFNLDQYIQRDFPEVFASRKPRDFVKYQDMTFRDFYDTASESAFLSLAPLHPNPDAEFIAKFIRENYDRLISSNNKYFFRKLISYYDWLKYGLI